MKNNSRYWALIPCAGVGSRAMLTLPKQYALVEGKPLVEYTIEAFLSVSEVAGVAVIVSQTHSCWSQMASGSSKLKIAACGGATRSLTVINGLRYLLTQGAHADDWVLVHDAVRCLITAEQITHLITACKEDEVGGLLAIPLADTLKEAGEHKNVKTVARDNKWLAQTPQMFRLQALMDALLDCVATKSITDESGAMELQGKFARLIMGSALNFKVTYPDDFFLARAVLKERKKGG